MKPLRPATLRQRILKGSSDQIHWGLVEGRKEGKREKGRKEGEGERKERKKKGLSVTLFLPLNQLKTREMGLKTEELKFRIQVQRPPSSVQCMFQDSQWMPENSGQL